MYKMHVCNYYMHNAMQLNIYKTTSDRINENLMNKLNKSIAKYLTGYQISKPMLQVVSNLSFLRIRIVELNWYF